MIDRLLRSYPPAWRERYGAELASLLEEQPVTWRVKLDVVRAGFRERARGSGLAGDDVSAPEQIRGGVLLVLCAWSVFVAAGCGYAKVSEHWQAVTPGDARSLPSAAYNALLLFAEFGTVAVLIGIAAALSGFVAFLRAGGWPSIRRHVVRAGLVSGVTVVLTGGLVYWGHQLTDRQRNGGSLLYGLAALLWALFVFTSLGLWTAAAVASARRTVLSPGRLRLEARLAGVVTVTMIVMTGAAAVWWSTVSSPASIQMSGITLTMLFATALAVAGSTRSLRVIRRSS